MENNGELYCLKWNQFQINIFSALENLHLTEDFADVTLYCDGTSHKAHKVILSACSPYFKSVFMVCIWIIIYYIYVLIYLNFD